jgi:PilZ domain
MRFTHNSLSTLIAWVSTCLLAAGVSTLFSESSRTLWLTWGCFGLASAAGLDIAARVRERMRSAELSRVANERFERELHNAAEDWEANAAIREAVARMLNGMKPMKRLAESRRAHERRPCDLKVEIRLHDSPNSDREAKGNRARTARIINLSEMGFELALREPLPPQRITMVTVAPCGSRLTMLADVLWSRPEEDGTYLAGGRFRSVISCEN